MSRLPSEEAFSTQLETWLRTEEARTVGSLADVFAERGFAVTILFLMFFPALPLPTGGITHVFEAIAIIVASEMVLGVKRVWIPKRLRQRDLGPFVTEKTVPFMIRRIRWFERLSRPRWRGLVESRAFNRLSGLVLIVFCFAAGLAPPFSGLDTLPAMGAVIVALGLILSDILIVIIGVVVGTGGIVLIVALGAALYRGFLHLF